MLGQVAAAIQGQASVVPKAEKWCMEVRFGWLAYSLIVEVLHV